MTAACDLCACTNLEALYVPLGRAADEVVAVCPSCSLVQTLPRPRRSTGKTPRLSSGADFGNLRYHKGLMSERALAFLRRLVAPERIKTVLDVGANRGHLVRALDRWLGRARIVAVEPDRAVLDWRAECPWIRVVPGRFEEIDLEGERFDLVTCFHTLEHVDCPRAFLEKMRGLLAWQGRLYLEVPDLACIAEPAQVEEFFIDKHLYHFSRPVLEAYLRLTGFRPIAWGEGDDSSLSLLAEVAPRRACLEEVVPALGCEVAATRSSIGNYALKLRRNLEATTHVGSFIRSQAGRRILFWGAGRIFSAFVGARPPAASVPRRRQPLQAGGEQVAAGRCSPFGEAVVGIVDRYLLQPEVGGMRVLRPEEAKDLAPDCVIVFSRDYFREIEREARAMFGDRVRVIRYDQLMAPAAEPSG